MQVKRKAMPSSWHEEVYHATHGCQAASLSLTAARWRGLLWVCQVESPKMSGYWLLVNMFRTIVNRYAAGRACLCCACSKVVVS